MPQLFTITGNLLAETTSIFSMPELGETVRAIGQCSFSVGGKGINVTRTAIKLGIESTAIIFPAGLTGKRCIDKLSAENIPTISTIIEGETREGLVCIDKSTNLRTTFLGGDVNISQSAFYDVINQLKTVAKQNDILALCGSFPNWKSEYANEIISLAKNLNLRLCIDTYGKPLSDFINRNFDMLKINFDELKILLKDYNKQSLSYIEAFEFAKNTLFNNVKILIITDGQNDILTSFETKFSKITPTKIKNALYATGCGDAFLASFIASYFCKNNSFEDSLVIASKYATSIVWTNNAK